MTTPVLEVQNIGKSYRDWGSEWRRVLSWFGLPLRPRAEHWTLKDIGFAIRPGEAVGIVGQNGAGKSTLLKIITGTLKPTTGSITARGRIAAILELGMGFHPDLTGRQNAHHAAGLMGFSPEQIAAAMPDIESFAEIGEYFDQPVRTYSSGMQMRVAFAVATAWRPEVLIVDEALSVGDAYFQHKSFGRIREFRGQGTTLLIVSHDQAAILGLCHRAMLLHKGRLIQDGAPDDVMDYYNALLAEKESHEIRISPHETGRLQTTSGTGEVEIKDVRLFDEHGQMIDTVNVNQAVELRICIQSLADVPRLVMGFLIKDRLGQAVFGTNTHLTHQEIELLPSGSLCTYSIRFPMNLGPGHYSFSIAIVKGESHLVQNYAWRDLAYIFTVINATKDGFTGSTWLPTSIGITCA